VKLTAIVPVYNEQDTVLEVLRRLQAVELPGELEVVVVDDGSRDGTAELLRDLEPAPGVVIHLCAVNGGKGAAVRQGIELATGDYIVIQDADLELDPGEHPRLLEPVLAGRAQVVFGSRFLGKPPVWSSVNWWANRVLTQLTNLLFGAGLTDMETCYKLFPAAFLKGIHLEARRFEIEPELTAKAIRLGHRIHEVPIAYSPRTVFEGKKMRWSDGFLAVAMLVRVRLAPRASLRRKSPPV
jgi:glycosyltransferase involved in cell wall biosynthesis